jgi:16S rRNA (uracil1498-N3)-methyltransferase
MRRFFIPPGAVAEGIITVDGDLFQHMARVLRLRVDAPVLLADGTGREFSGTIREMHRERLVIAITETRMTTVLGDFPRITLYQGLPKGDKLELILQKAVELGAAEIVPFLARRSVVRVKGKEDEKLARWQRIAREAARQSGQTTIPRISFSRDTADVVQQAQQSVKLMLWEREQDNRLKETLTRFSHPNSVAVLVGPEGGLHDEEAEHAIQGGFIPVSLGDRIVRTETASLVVLAILQFYWGDIG